MVGTTLRRWINRLLKIEESPRRIALAFSIGVFIGFSPLLGFHTVIGLAIAFVFGLNRGAILLGLFINNPWTLVPIYAFATYLGGLVVGFPAALSFSNLGWHQVWRSEFWLALLKHWDFLTPMFVGSGMLSVFCAAVSYPLALLALKRARTQRNSI
jgi:uncharacterized protein (DUF2062 family)